MASREQGFTLTELLVAVAIVAIITAIALPLYTQYTQRSYFAEVQADLLGCAQTLERRNSINFTYGGNAVGPADDGVIEPTVCDAQSVRNVRYSIRIDLVGTGYMLTAIPDAGGPMAPDTGDLTLTDAGVRTWDEDGNGTVDADDNDWIKDN